MVVQALCNSLATARALAPQVLLAQRDDCDEVSVKRCLLAVRNKLERGQVSECAGRELVSGSIPPRVRPTAESGSCQRFMEAVNRTRQLLCDMQTR
eukprot:768394-Hanusia_phi.AAC.4